MRIVNIVSNSNSILQLFMKSKPTPDIFFITLLTLIIIFHFLFPIKEIITFPFNLIGIIFIIMGLFIAYYVIYLLSKAKTTVVPYEMPSRFIKSGSFKYSRNPLYIGMFFALLGVAILLGTVSSFVFPIILIVLIDRLVIPTEEKNLENKFGGEYVNYKRKVRRWI